MLTSPRGHTGPAWPVALVAAAIALTAAAVWLRWGDAAPAVPPQDQQNSAVRPSPESVQPSQTPAPDTATPAPQSTADPTDAGREISAETAAAAAARGPSGYGSFPSVPRDANPAVTAVYEAIETGSHPERLSPLMLPAPFDAQAWRSDPDAYLRISEPGRIWQVAQPAPETPRLRPLVPLVHEVEQNQRVTLIVRAAPDAPVSWNVGDGGVFTANRLPAITVRSSATGEASVEYLPTSGTVAAVEILCGCPLASGQVHFRVHVAHPDRPIAPVVKAAP